MNLYKHDPIIYKLKCGMEVHLIRDYCNATYIECFIRFGSIEHMYKYGDAAYILPTGSAHFFEHLIYASKKGDYFAKFAKMSLDANAVTSYSHTAYSLSGINRVDEGLKLLLNMLDETYFNPDNVAREREIIEEEINMYNSDIDEEMTLRLLRNTYPLNGHLYDICGTITSIEQITPEILSLIHHHFYHPANRILVITGNIDVEKYQKILSDYDDKCLDNFTPHYPIMINDDYNLVESERIKLDLPMEKLYFSIRLPYCFVNQVTFEDEVQIYYLIQMLIGKSSKFYEDALNDGLINANYTYQFCFEKTGAFVLIFGSTSDSDILAERLTNVLTKDILNNISAQELIEQQRGKTGSLIQALNNYEYKTFIYGQHQLIGLSIEEAIKINHDVTFANVCSKIDVLKKSKFCKIHIDI